MKKTQQQPLAGKGLLKQKTSLEKLKSDPGHCLEIGGVKGPEPTRFGDWEKKGRCVDF